MPELPEVETVRRGLAPHLEGRKVLGAKAFSPMLRIPVPADFADRLEGRTIERLTRRAKYLLAELSGEETMILHLGMSGQLRVVEAKGDFRPARHDHLMAELEGGKRLVFNDPRRFGLVAFASRGALGAHPFFAGLGPEPLGNEFSGPVLHAALNNCKTAVKQALLDQRVVAGLGNIYASEALFRAGINPRRRASSLSGVRAGRLAKSVKAVLRDAIRSGGSSLRNYVQADGAFGLFQHRFEVYEREGKPCPREGCPGAIRRFTQGARSTYYCPRCQR